MIAPTATKISVGHRRQRQDDRGPHPEPAGAQPVGQQTEAQHGERERDRERVLAGHRGLHVAAVDLEALVEEERQPGHREQLGDRMTERSEATEGPAGRREQHQAGDGDELERHPVREQDVECDDRQRRDHHVEAVQGQPAVPVHAPPRELEVRQEVVAQERRRPHVGAHVAARGRGVVEHQVAARRQRVEVDDHHHDDRGRDEGGGGDEHLHHPLVGPRALPPGDGAAHHAAGDPRRQAAVLRGRGPLGRIAAGDVVTGLGAIVAGRDGTAARRGPGRRLVVDPRGQRVGVTRVVVHQAVHSGKPGRD